MTHQQPEGFLALPPGGKGPASQTVGHGREVI